MPPNDKKVLTQEKVSRKKTKKQNKNINTQELTFRKYAFNANW